MTYAIIVAPTAARGLTALPPKILSAIVGFIYGDLADNPHRVGKELGRELGGTYSARRGPYRVLYEIRDAQLVVLVIRVEHRADIYRRP